MLADFELAAIAACDAAEAPIKSSIPEGGEESLVTNFRTGNELVYRFRLDSTHPYAVPWTDQYYCAGIKRDWDEFDASNNEAWWFEERDWTNGEGEVAVYMATRDVERVMYTGSGTNVDGSWPSNPQYEAIHFDISAICPEYPDLWIPPGDPPDALTVCWRYAAPVAEAILVRLE